MEELKQAMEREIKMNEPSDEEDETELWDHPLQGVAERWAIHSMRTYQGELLKSALEISGALSSFAYTITKI